MEGVARLAPGITAAQAQAELDRIAEDLAEIYPDENANMGLRAIPLRQHLFGDVESPLFLLLGAVGLVLLIAAANVAGLQLTRAAGRSREYALRGALGASSWRILRLVTAESLLLAFAGGLMGIGLTYVGVDIIRASGPNHLPRVDELRIDGPVLAFALMAAVGSALIASIAPALRASRSDLHVALTDSSRGSTRGPRASRLRDRLVVAEIALALVLTIGAGLLVRSFGTHGQRAGLRSGEPARGTGLGLRRQPPKPARFLSASRRGDRGGTGGGSRGVYDRPSLG